MEEIIFQLYGTLILTLLGFVLPIITIALSAFTDGVDILRQKYENEESQATQNLEEELKKQKTQSGVDVGLLLANIRILKKTKKVATRKLLYLTPWHIVTRSTLVLGFSFTTCLASLTLLEKYPYPSILSMIVSLGTLYGAFVIFAYALDSIVEAAGAVQDQRRAGEEKHLELLTAIADNTKNSGNSLYVDSELVSIYFHDEVITKDKVYTFSVSKKHTVNVSLRNSSEQMIKTVEIGFYLPQEVIVEGKTVKLYTGENEKIARIKMDFVQARENMQTEIDLSFLNEGVHNVSAFMKGENLKRKVIKFKIKIIP